MRYTYDADGNRLTRAVMPGTPGVKTDNYTRYDHRNLLNTLTMESSANPAANGLHVYLYDHRSRRTFNFTPLLSDVGRLSFSGGQSVQEQGDLYATTPSKQTIRGSDMGGGVGGELYTNVGATSPVFNHYNSRGDVVSQTNNGGGVEWEAFDTGTEEAGVPTGRQRANTKDEDLTGLLNEGMRYRDLEAGVFITRGPAGFVDGPNVCTYVRQNPWSKFDPEGLWEISVFGQFKLSSEATAEKAAKLNQGFGEVTGRKFGMEKIEELKRDPAEFAKGLGRGYLNPDGDPQSLAEEAGQFLAIGEALLSLGRSSAKLGGNSGLRLAFATGNAAPAQAIPTTVTSPLPAGAILQNNQEIKPGGKSQRDISEENAARGAVKPGNTGTYGELKSQKKDFGETEALDMDHQPSFAAQVSAKEAALGRKLTQAERAAVKKNTPAVASPRAVHQQTSPTYGGRNSPSRIAEDAADLEASSSSRSGCIRRSNEKAMSITTETLANYLGREASILLGDQPFKNWIFERSFEEALEKPLIEYVFAQNGFDFVCDEEDKVQSIFLYFDQSRHFKEAVEDLPFTSNRQEVIARLGLPSKSGSRISDPILGEYGAWDRFIRSGYVIHIEYRLNSNTINKITLMRADVVP